MTDPTEPLPADIRDLRRVPAEGDPARLVNTKPPVSDRNCITAWLPTLVKSGVPTPRTEVVTTEPDMPGSALLALLDGATPDGFAPFMGRLRVAYQKIAPDGGRVFLRTGHTSGKHSYRDTCHVPRLESLGKRVGGLVEYSSMAGVFGLPTGVWAVREFLPVSPLCYLAKYGGFPLVPEVRAFVRGGRVQCVHGYWPPHAIRDGMDKNQLNVIGDADGASGAILSLNLLTAAANSVLADDVPAVMGMAEAVAAAFKDFPGGDGWSVDLLDTDAGWHAIDMAEADRSYHDPACPLSPEHGKPVKPVRRYAPGRLSPMDPSPEHPPGQSPDPKESTGG